MLKFRTMYADAAGQQAELEASNEADGPLFKIREDPRVTSVGAVLRRLSLDEIPQLWNVLRGEMSLVGPRPLPLRDFERLEQWHRKRYLVLPGVTGLWQISGRSNLDFDDLVRLDFYYLENWSIWLDISILLKTVPAVLERPRRVLRWSASSSPARTGSSAGTCGPSSARRSCRSTATCSTRTPSERPYATRSPRRWCISRPSPRWLRPGRTRSAPGA